MVVNENLLLAKLKEKGYRREDVAEKLGLSINALDMKIHNKTEFKASEIMTLSRLLGISKQKDKYFFVLNVDCESTKE